MVRNGKAKTPEFSGVFVSGAGNGARTRDPNLGKVVLYQLSYSRIINLSTWPPCRE